MDAERPDDSTPLPLLYSELAPWFHLLTAPEDYHEESVFYSRLLNENSRVPVNRVLEMGSGGGNNASHMKSRYTLTLTDLSEEMLSISRKINPECEHIPGDMRNLRLGRQFDAVFVHDAVSYIVTETDLSATVETAYVHCRPGGAVVLCPDYTRETFTESTGHGGHSAGGRGLRYLEWAWDPDPSDTKYIVDMAYVLKDGDGVRCRHDRHRLGLFTGDTWRELMSRAGLTSVKTVPYPESIDKTGLTPVFVGVRPG